MSQSRLRAERRTRKGTADEALAQRRNVSGGINFTTYLSSPDVESESRTVRESLQVVVIFHIAERTYRRVAVFSLRQMMAFHPQEELRYMY